MTTTRQRLAGLGATLVLLALVVGAPLILLGIGARPWETPFDELRVLLFSPDDGHLALFVMTVVAWCGWAFTAFSFVVEIVSRARGIQAPQLRGFAVPQDAVGRLVAAAALLFTIAPIPTPASTPLTAHAAPVSPAMTHDEIPGPPGAPDTLETTETPAPMGSAMAAPKRVSRSITTTPGPARGQGTIAYTVRRGDSLWRIAEQRLGDGARFIELVDLNAEVLNGQADFIRPGLVLRLPAEATIAEQDTHLVVPGDTLWDVADEHLGDPKRYPEIVQASQATVQNDGRKLIDPNLIRPGWRLTIPTHPNSAEVPDTVRETEPHATQKVRPVPGQDPVVPASPDSGPEAGTDRAGDPAVEVTQEPPAEADDESVPLAQWLLPGLLGGGALLAGGVLIALRAHQRTQQRHRRPGFTIAPPPPVLRNVEKTVTVTGGPAANALEKLNLLLMHLAQDVGTPPALHGVELSRTRVTLHLVEARTPVAPWTGTEMAWSCDLDAAADDLDGIPPYPLLTSIGQAPDGNLWLLDLEMPRIVTLGGDPDRARALARHLAAELVLNPWGMLNQVDTIDLAPELSTMSEGRFQHHAQEDLDFLRWLKRAADCDGDPEGFHVLLVPASVSATSVDDFAQFIQTHHDRTGCTVIKVGDPTDLASMPLRLELTADGHLLVPQLSLTLTAAGLSADEAAACAALVDITHHAQQAPIPHDANATGRRALADQAGALREELTEPRPETGAAGPQSLLPATTEEHEAAADTTIDDIGVLAPLVPTQSRRQVEDADPDLDRDVADWFDAQCPVPRLILLGAVDLRAPTERQRPLERRPFYCELMAYLALHHPGVRGPAVRAAFSLTPKRLRTDIALLRDWLGVSPRSGELHLPLATDTAQHRAHGTNGYVLHDVLVDFDLFTRLRARGQARGAEGMTDLVTALELVRGTPFSNLRREGWQWLLDDERVHDTALQAVVDVAHLVVVNALARGDLAVARATGEKACRVAPDHDSCTLDLARILEAQGDVDAARKLLKDRIHNRTDDDLGPIDLPRRTALLEERRTGR